MIEVRVASDLRPGDKIQGMKPMNPPMTVVRVDDEFVTWNHPHLLGDGETRLGYVDFYLREGIWTVIERASTPPADAGATGEGTG